ncbi:AraC family transcriptional regulator [Listeria ivanovii]|uniref:AraC family transcriptional regulator n=2 Tax=Listeria ivanovii TaxID=1638 RepID=A0ABS1G1X2_LISIV|nr:AraC family transcriptional regulator [Listeria ivanovii]AIS58603.1 AraC family transcriptional regulator [Listeria ivanovii subsp. londoniensis]AIS61398.1 AraC family transcriptional regulator [Listeria ivanovii subsp. londoniensis]MBC2255543.1 AraC family transcriptional regulator [Listeria ivanovii]MBK1960872.1 AraC family transcriptional regulator [Listeria ivanovii subsp. londoniensis]MBK1966119.1 AraC family transcriptional regulator [Listeria ivanovii subsp. londoniensis]
MLKINTTTFNPQVLYIASYYTNEPRIGENHHHDFLEISIICEGTSVYDIEGERVELSAGDVLVFNPGVNHYDITEPGMTNVQLHIGFRNFTLEGYTRNTFPFKKAFLRKSKTESAILNIAKQIIDEKDAEKPGYDLMLKANVMQLIIHILREATPEQLENNGMKLSTDEQQKQMLVNEIIHYMEKHHSEDVSLSSLSQTMYISPAYISKVFKEETGESPINYLIKIRLTRAEELLKNKDITVKQAANMVGYNDAYYFSKLFKKYYGFPPSENWRKSS